MTLRTHGLIVAFMLIAAVPGTPAVGSAQTSEPPSARTIQGVWRTVVTPYNCLTGDPITSLSGVFTFNEGGTMAEYGIGPGQTPALRSPGHGVWNREHGWQQYSFSFMFYRYNAAGALVGSQKITAALELGGSGDSFASRSSIAILDLNGNVAGMGCATAVGTRFE